MEQYYGTYRGFMPSDESAIGLSEFKLEVSADEYTLTHATGLQNEVRTYPCTLREMTLEEIDEDLDTSDDQVTDFKGFWLGNGRFRVVLATVKGNVAGLFLGLGLAEEFYGPSALFAPCENLDELIEEAVRDIETLVGKPGAIPRIANDGLAPNSLASQ